MIGKGVYRIETSEVSNTHTHDTTPTTYSRYYITHSAHHLIKIYTGPNTYNMIYTKTILGVGSFSVYVLLLLVSE